MSKKKTNLGKLCHQVKDLDELFENISKDANAFVDDIQKLLSNFDVRNPYDMTVLEVLLANLLANVKVTLEDEYPGFDKDVFGLYEVYSANLREMKQEQNNQ